MKIKSLLAGMFACAALVACTNNDLVEDGGSQPLEGDAYMAVNIVMPSENGSRALGGFEDGSPAETGVTDATFLFLDASFNGCADPCKVTEFSFDSVTSPEGAQSISKAVLIINNDRVQPAYVVAIINPKAGQNFTATTSLSDLKGLNADYKVIDANKFVMSNSVYKGGNGAEVAATPVPVDKIFSKPEDAKNNPITIAVERVVAKVKVDHSKATVKLTETNNEVRVDNVNTELNVTITGWEVLQNKESYLIKNIKTTWQGTWWNDAANYRSYWATSYQTAGRTSYPWNSMTNNDDKYAQETTTDEAGETPYLLVSAKISKKDGSNISLVEFGGVKYTDAGYLNYVASNSTMSQYWYLENEEAGVKKYSQFSPSFLALQSSSNHGYLAKAVLTDNAKGKKFYTVTLKANGEVDTATGVDVTEVETALATFKEVKYWNGGATYYYTAIEQYKEGETTYNGIVRNHAYDITINSINGFGTPVADPNTAIETPETPTDDETYLAAKVMILKWKAVTQNVDLGK